MPTPDELVAAFYRAYNSHDAAEAATLYSENGVHMEIAFGNERAGREALVKGLEGFFAMMPDVLWRERQRVRSGDSIAIIYEMTGTFTPRAKEGEAPRPRKPVRLAGLHILEFAGDQIAVSRDYWDKADFLAQIA